jgi:predicted solute-binding protein
VIIAATATTVLSIVPVLLTTAVHADGTVHSVLLHQSRDYSCTHKIAATHASTPPILIAERN